jgi:hypothetical protein
MQVMNMWIQKLSTDLGLKEYGQDWGIINSDPNRVLEFVAYYQNNSVDHPWEPEALAELIFQSMNDAIEYSSASDEMYNIFCNFIHNHSPEFPETLNYWVSLKGNVEFPIAKVIIKGIA